MPAKAKGKKGEDQGTEIRLLETASKELQHLDTFKDILHETGELVYQHNQLARPKIIPSVGPAHVKWPEVTKRATHLMARLACDEYKFPALVALEKDCTNSNLKEELGRLLHIVSSLVSEYTEILTVIDQYPQTIIMMWSSELKHLDNAAAATSKQIQDSMKPAARA